MRVFPIPQPWRNWFVFLLLFLKGVSGCLASPPETGLELEFRDYQDVSLEDLLHQVVVTATRKEALLENSPATMHVITEEEIRLSPAQTLSDLLRRVPGFQTKTWLSQFTNTSIRGMLGASVINERILWLVDGVPVNDVRDGGIWTDITIPLHNIKRIEVYSGPGSALYGTSAFQGVVHIITLDPDDILKRKDRGRVTTSWGTFQTTVNSMVVAGNTGRTKWLWTADAGSTEGPGLVRDRNRPGEKRHSDRQWNYVRGKYQWGGNRVQVGLRRVDQDYDGADFAFFRRYTWRRGEEWIDWHYDRPTSSRIHDSAVFSWHRYSEGFRDFADIPDLQYDIDSHRWFANVQRDQRVGRRHQLSFGTGIRAEYYRGNDFYPEFRDLSHTNAHVFFHDEIELTPTWTFFAGARYDSHPRYDNIVSPHLSLIHRLRHDRGRLRLTYGTSYKEPSNWQSYIDQPTGMGNPTMKPERLKALELALDYKLTGNLHSGFTVFQMKHDRIIWENFDPAVADPAYAKFGIFGKFHPRQPGDSARIRGLEAFVRHTLSHRTRLFLNGTWLDTRDDDDRRFQYDAHRRLGFVLNHTLSSRLRFCLEHYRVSETIDTVLAGDPTVGIRAVPAYEVTGLAVECRLSPLEVLKVSGWNLGRGIYEEMLGAGVPGTIVRFEYRRRF